MKNEKNHIEEEKHEVDKGGELYEEGELSTRNEEQERKGKP